MVGGHVTFGPYFILDTLVAGVNSLLIWRDIYIAYYIYIARELMTNNASFPPAGCVFSWIPLLWQILIFKTPTAVD